MANLTSTHSGHGGHRLAPVDVSGTALAQTETFETFGCEVSIDNPKTPQLVTRDRLPPGMVLKEFVRKFFNGVMVMPDGTKIEIWAFEDPLEPDPRKRRQFPSAPIVVNEGDLVHTKLEAGKNSHTIHHHGIEPTSFNDGVGHTSFEVTGSYIYQWRATEVGTFFYHCHKNTVLHVEMGMYGALNVLPREHRRPDGRYNAFPLMRDDVAVPSDVLNRTSFRTRDDLRAYDVEVLWFADEFDPSWHKRQHNAGMCGEDAGFNNFNPKHFLVSGVPFYQEGPRRGKAFAPNPDDLAGVEVMARFGQTALVRFVHAGYSVLDVDFPPELEVVVVEDTGRQLGGQRSPYSRPFAVPLDPAVIAPVEITPARRATCLMRAKRPGRYEIAMSYRHWISSKLLGVAMPAINFL